MFGWTRRPTEERHTYEEWSKLLDEPNRPLTLDEYRALELLVMAHSLARCEASLDMLTAALGVHPEKHGGYLEQIRNTLDRFVRVVLRPRRAPAGQEPRALLDGDSTKGGE